jgi:biopolymer transport protein ExbB/TolQ
MNETLLLGGVLGLLVVIGVTTLAIAARTLRSARRAERGGNERLEILREQQERLKLMYQERRMLEEELKRERDRRAQLERALERATLESLPQEDGQQQLPAVRAALPAPPRHPWWRHWLGGWGKETERGA